MSLDAGAKFSRSGLLIIQGNLVFEPLLRRGISQLLSLAPALSGSAAEFYKMLVARLLRRKRGTQNVQSLLCVILCQTRCPWELT